jgi:MFS family permease
MALLVTRANVLGRKPLLIIAFAALPLRCLLCAAYGDPSWLLGVQLLDGVAAGILDALLPLVLADMMSGSGRYSLARGLLGTIQGIGGSTGLGAAGELGVAVLGLQPGDAVDAPARARLADQRQSGVDHVGQGYGAAAGHGAYSSPSAFNARKNCASASACGT